MSENDPYTDMAITVVENKNGALMKDLDHKKAEQERHALMMGKIEKLLITGDLNSLNEEERGLYYRKRCEDLGLDPLSRPFDYLSVPNPIRGQPNRLLLYANKNCFEQIRKNRSISVSVTKIEEISGILTVHATAKEPIFDNVIDPLTGEILGRKILDYRSDDDIGAVVVNNLAPLDKVNACMKATTKAKRRATLSLCGLGMLDETETETIKGAVKITQEDTKRLSEKLEPEKVLSLTTEEPKTNQT